MSKAQLQLTFMLILTFSTGIVDAVGYLGYDKIGRASCRERV